MRKSEDAFAGLPLKRKVELNAICERFEDACQSGEPLPRIEFFLDGVSEAERKALTPELIYLDIFYRKHRGQNPAAEQYNQRFPNCSAAWLEELIASGNPQDPAQSISDQKTIDYEVSEGPGTTIGSYKLLEQIGEGGMGAVFMAEQREPVRRKVALKIIKPGMDTKEVIARFEAERQALAMMEHSHIARVLDAGATETGRPYFVMELVRGVPITKYCDEARLTTRERLELFVPVCQAIQHAHQKGIIHRDVKPSNVLVTLHDGVPVVKVIDFGIAKAIGGSLTDKTLFTGFAQFVGTPVYVSPEQAELSGLDIDTRSDVYSLGVLLYELLTGCLPFDKERLKTVAFDELRRIIREEEPPRMSARISTMGELAATVSERRRSNPHGLSRLFRGELDWIVMKALEKDRNRRYETANGFARDVQRYLADEAVQACPPSGLYRLRKFARRHKGWLAAASMLVLALLIAVGGLAGGIGWALRDKAAQDLAKEKEADFALSQALQALQQSKPPEAAAWVRRAEVVLKGSQPSPTLENRLNGVRADLTMLSELEKILIKKSDNDKEHRFKIAESDTEYAKSFRAYGIDVDALDPAEAAKRIRSRSIGVRLAAALDDWASVRRYHTKKKDRWKHLLALARAADPNPVRCQLRDAWEKSDLVALQRLAADKGIDLPPSTILLLVGALGRNGKIEEAFALLRKGQQRHPDNFWMNLYMANRLNFAKPARVEEAVAFYRAAVALRPDSPRVHMYLATALRSTGKPAEALAEYSTAIDLSPNYALAWNNRGAAYTDLKQYDQAVVNFSKAIKLKSDYWFVWYNRGRVNNDRKQFDKAIADFSQAIKIKGDSVDALTNRGLAYARLKRYKKAIADYDQALVIDEKDPATWNNRGNAYVALKQYKKAVADFDQSIKFKKDDARPWTNRGIAYYKLKQYKKALADHTKAIKLEPKHASAWSNRGLSYSALKKDGKALADFNKALEINGKIAGVWINRGNAYLHLKQYDEAIADYDRAIEINEEDLSAFSNRGRAYSGLKDKINEDIVGALNNRGQAHTELKQYKKAIKDFDRALDINNEMPVVLYNRGNAFLHLKQFQKAIDNYDKAIGIKNDYGNALCNRGNAYIEIKNYKKAIADFNRAIKLDNDHAEAWTGRGNVYSDLKQYDKAIADFNKAIKIKEDNADAWYNRGNAYIDMKQYAKAISDYSQAININEDYVKAWNNRGNTYRKIKQYDKALVDFDQAIEIDKNMAEVWYNRGLTYAAQKQYSKAIDDYSQAVKFKKDLVEARIDRGNLYLLEKQFDKAIVDFDHIIKKINKDHLAGWIGRGNAYSELKQFDKAIDDFSQAIKIKGDYALPWYNRGNAYRDLKQYAQAIADYTAAIKLEKDYAAALNNRGDAFRALRKYRVAIADFDLAIKINRNIAEVWNNRGLAYAALGQYAQAIADYNQAIKINKEIAEVWNNRGLAYAALGQYARAVADYSTAIEIKMDYMEAWNNRGNAYRGLRQYDKAIDDFDRAIEINKGMPEVWYNRGLTFYILKRYAKAVAAFGQAIKLKPNMAIAWNSLAWLLATCPDPKFHNAPRAVKFAEKAVQLAPKVGTYWNTLGVARYRATEHRSAIDALNKSIKIQGGNSGDWFFLAMAYRKLGKKGEARKWYDRAVAWMEKFMPNDEELRRFHAEAQKVLGVKNHKDSEK